MLNVEFNKTKQLEATRFELAGYDWYAASCSVKRVANACTQARSDAGTPSGRELILKRNKQGTHFGIFLDTENGTFSQK